MLETGADDVHTGAVPATGGDRVLRGAPASERRLPVGTRTRYDSRAAPAPRQAARVQRQLVRRPDLLDAGRPGVAPRVRDESEQRGLRDPPRRAQRGGQRDARRQPAGRARILLHSAHRRPARRRARAHRRESAAALPPGRAVAGGGPPSRTARASRRRLHQRRQLGGDIRAEQLGGREGDDLGPRAGRTLRAVRPRGSLLPGCAVCGIGTATVVLVDHALAALTTLATVPTRAARPARASRTARFDQAGEERILGRDDDADAAAAPAAPPGAAVAAAATRSAGLGRAPSLARGARPAGLPPRAPAAAVHSVFAVATQSPLPRRTASGPARSRNPPCSRGGCFLS